MQYDATRLITMAVTSSIPNVSYARFHGLVAFILSHINTSGETLLYALCLLNRVHCIIGDQLNGNNVTRFFAVSFILANQMLMDAEIPLHLWRSVFADFDTELLVYLQATFLSVLKWDILVPSDELNWMRNYIAYIGSHSQPLQTVPIPLYV